MDIKLKMQIADLIHKAMMQADTNTYFGESAKNVAVEKALTDNIINLVESESKEN